MDFTEEENQLAETTKKSSNLQRVGTFLVAVAVLFILWNFYPALLEEGRYYLSSKNNSEVLTKKEADAKKNAGAIREANILEPLDENFGIVIPKILANAKVFAGVDPNNPAEYQKVLTEGVAQAKNTALPGEEGNIFIFAHSGLDFYEAARYNAVFYLLNKMEKGDEIFLFYQGQKIRYTVTENKVVNAEDVQYYDDRPGQKTLTLMTCWPAGTDWKRLVVVAEQAN
ncbi:MAG: sortase [Parcubacteria group bacterium]|jgi:sortase A